MAIFQTQNYQAVPGNPDWGGPVTDVDNASEHPEDAAGLPWTTDPESSYMDYRCWVEIELDAGIVLHKILPQVNPAVDSLSSIDIDAANFAEARGGVNIKSNSNALDFIQRMASSTYCFYLRGTAQRIGYQVPIPGLKSVAGIPVVPEGKQRAANILNGSLPGGIPVWFAYWEIRYVLVRSPQRNEPPIPPNLAEHVSADTPLPTAIFPPRTITDQNAVTTPSPATQQLGFFVTG